MNKVRKALCAVAIALMSFCVVTSAASAAKGDPVIAPRASIAVVCQAHRVVAAKVTLDNRLSTLPVGYDIFRGSQNVVTTTVSARKTKVFVIRVRSGNVVIVNAADTVVKRWTPPPRC